MSRVPGVFPVGGRRLVVYVVFDRRGGVDDYVPYALAGLREHAAHVLVVVNGSLSEEGRGKLEAVSDEILVRENVGFDIWAHKDALDHVGSRLSEFDEVLLTNDTWFGPMRPYAPVFDRMGERATHFWGMTDHAREDPNPFTGKGVLPYHLQSFWIAVRREMFLSEEWARYWRELPEMPSYFDAVLKHETIFTDHFAQLGFTHDVAYPAAEIGTKNPSLYRAEALLDAGCPVMKRRPFMQWPPYLDRHAVVGRWTLEKAAQYGYPMELFWENAARTIPPKDLNTDAAMLEVLPDYDRGYDPEAPLRTVVIAHIFYVEMTDEMLDRADTLPGDYDLVVTTPDLERASAIAETLTRRGHRRGAVDIRVVSSNDGRDQSAFLIECRDVLLGDDYDLVVKIHSKKTPQDGFNVGRHFKEQQFDNLLNSQGYTANLVSLFQKEPGLGMVFPPMIHIGYPTLGRGWSVNKEGAADIAEQLGIFVPLDDISPLAPFGSMYVARPQALRLLISHPWTYEQFGGAEAYKDGGLAHILERIPAYAAGELGYHVRTVSTTEYMSISHSSLEFKLDEMSVTTPGYAYEQIELIRLAGFVGTGSRSDFARMYMRVNFPGTGARVREIMASDTLAGKVARAVRRPRAAIRRIFGR